MYKKLRKVFFAVAVLFLFPACKSGVPSDLIQPTEMENLLYDYHIAQAMAETGSDSMNLRRYGYVLAVFKKHGVSEAEFDSSMVWYASHTTYLNDIYKRIQERYDAYVTALGASAGESDIYAHLDTQGDTADIWNERRCSVLKPRFSENRLMFTMDADTTFRKGDVLLWRFNSHYISHGRQSEAYAALYMIFDNDSATGITQRIYSNNLTQLRVKGDTAHAIHEVGGFVYYEHSDGDTEPRLLLLRDIMLVRIHPLSMAADTTVVPVATDSASVAPYDTTLHMIPVDKNVHRLSPTELRDSRQVERSIHVVKEKPYRVVRRRGTSRGGRGRR